MSATVDRWPGSRPPARVTGLAPVFALAAAAVAIVGLAVGAPQLPMALAAVGALAASVVLFPSVGAVLFSATVWANAPVVLAGDGGPALELGALAALLVFVPAFVQIYVLRKGWVVDRPLLLMIAFLGVLLLSTLVAKDYDIAISWITTYLAEGLLVYLLVVNAIRDESTLRRAIWALLVVCGLLGATSVYQEVTRDYQREFAGFAQRKLTDDGTEADFGAGGLARSRDRVGPEDRACGPVADPNYFAQILLVVLPLGIFLAAAARKILPRVAALLFSTLILSGVLLTYSRGGFLVLGALVLLLGVLGHLRLRVLVPAAVAVAGIAIAVAPGYVKRMDTIRDVSNVGETGDAALRGRATEMLAAWNVLLDHPFVGVGPGQYTPFYSVEYMDDPGVAFRRIEKQRRAHSLYFELGAETGVLGLSIFLGLAALMLWRLHLVQRRFRGRGDLAFLASGLTFAILAYLGTSAFLSFAFMRYWWLLVALAGATWRVATSLEEGARRDDEQRMLREAAG